jgi:hypothetical protein
MDTESRMAIINIQEKARVKSLAKRKASKEQKGTGKIRDCYKQRDTKSAY